MEWQGLWLGAVGEKDGQIWDGDGEGVADVPFEMY